MSDITYATGEETEARRAILTAHAEQMFDILQAITDNPREVWSHSIDASKLVKLIRGELLSGSAARDRS